MTMKTHLPDQLRELLLRIPASPETDELQNVLENQAREHAQEVEKLKRVVTSFRNATVSLRHPANEKAMNSEVPIFLHELFPKDVILQITLTDTAEFSVGIFGVKEGDQEKILERREAAEKYLTEQGL